MDDVHIQVWFAPMHPYLAEYRRWVEVAYDGRTQKKEVFADTGGYSWIVLRHRDGNLEVYTMGGTEFAIPVRGVASSAKEYLGRFDFDAQHRYTFIPSLVDSRDPSIPFDTEKP